MTRLVFFLFFYYFYSFSFSFAILFMLLFLCFYARFLFLFEFLFAFVFQLLFLLWLVCVFLKVFLISLVLFRFASYLFLFFIFSNHPPQFFSCINCSSAVILSEICKWIWASLLQFPSPRFFLFLFFVCFLSAPYHLW